LALRASTSALGDNNTQVLAQLLLHLLWGKAIDHRIIGGTRLEILGLSFLPEEAITAAYRDGAPFN
jgi:hypothetical protein